MPTDVSPSCNHFCLSADYVSLAELYRAIYQYVLSRDAISELTVEDPAEAFEDLRDICDVKMLLSNEQFMKEGLELSDT